MHTFRLALFSTLFGVAAVSASPLGTDITISDANLDSHLSVFTVGSPMWNMYNNGWYGNHEDNETEPGTQSGQQWDLEAMYLSGNTLSLVGGYNFQAGQLANGHVYTSGDIFIDIDGNAQFGSAANGGSGRGGNVQNTFGYDYVIHFNSGLTSYSVFNLDVGPTVTLARGTDVAASNPWQYVSGGTLVSGWQNVTSMSVGTIADITPFGLLGYGGNNTHYGLSVDISFLPSNTLSTFHYTMECGNDALMGRGTTSVPDSGTTFGFVLAGIMMMGSARRLRVFRARAS